MRGFWPSITLAALAGCAAAGVPSSAPTKDGELTSAREAYAAYCDFCHDSAECCLGPSDFAPGRYSAAAGPYLRALREHYECMRGDVLIDATLYSPPALDLPEEGPRAPVPRSVAWQQSCEKYACARSAEAMARELDRALAQRVPHPPGAALVCTAATPAP